MFMFLSLFNILCPRALVVRRRSKSMDLIWSDTNLRGSQHKAHRCQTCRWRFHRADAAEHLGARQDLPTTFSVHDADLRSLGWRRTAAGTRCRIALGWLPPVDEELSWAWRRSSTAQRWGCPRCVNRWTEHGRQTRTAPTDAPALSPV